MQQSYYPRKIVSALIVEILTLNHTEPGYPAHPSTYMQPGLQRCGFPQNTSAIESNLRFGFFQQLLIMDTPDTRL